MLPTHMPYSQEGLVRLAKAIGVSPAQVWLNPVSSRVDIKQAGQAEESADYNMSESDESEL